MSKQQEEPHGLMWTARIAAAASIAAGALLFPASTQMTGLALRLPSWSVMKGNATVCFILSGTALLLLLRQPLSLARRRWSAALALLVTVSAAATLLEYLLGIDGGFDDLISAPPGRWMDILFPGRMSIAGGINFLLLGPALLLVQAGRERGAQVAAVLVACISLVVLSGYLFGAESLERPGSTAMSVPTAMTFVVISIGVLLARPRSGLMKLITSPGADGVMLRRLLPAIVITPHLLGAFIAAGAAAGVYPIPFAWALFSVITLLALGTFVWSNAVQLRRLDAERREAQERAQHRNLVLDAINAVFREGLTCETEERLGRACLTVCEQVTGAAFAFIGELGADGLFHDISVSDPGWDLCAMTDRSGHRRIPASFKVHGLYGHVLVSGTSLLTNDPGRHPSSIGTPEGHPPIQCFMGVPLFDRGSVTGMIAVANRPGGFDADNLDALEALAPAIVEAFRSKRAVDALRHTYSRMEEAVTELGNFTYTVSHNLRAPLRHLTGFVELVKRDNPAMDEKTAKRLKVVTEAADEMGKLVDELLAFTRIGHSRMPVSAVNLNVLVKEAIGRLAADAGNRAVEWQVEDLPVIQGDPAMLRVVVERLLENALKFTRPCPVATIAVGSRAREDETEIFVSDNGVGFDMKYQHKLFSLFQRLHSDREFEGTGVGLANVRRIVERHGGRVQAQGEPGRGATFSFTIPGRVIAAGASVPRLTGERRSDAPA